MFCPDCGSEVAEGRRFCGKCGGQLRAASGSVETGRDIPDSPVEAVVPVPRAPLSTRKKLTYALVALLVALGGVGWWWFHRPGPAYKVQDSGIYPFQGRTADGKGFKWGFIDADGKVVIQPEWDGVALTSVMGQTVFCSEGLCGVLKDGKWGYVDYTGHLVIPNQFDGITGGSTGPFVEGLARVNLGNQVGYIDKTGKYVINPQFDAAFDFHEGLALVHADGGWGFINKAGALAIKPRFQGADAAGFSDGMAMVVESGKCGYINSSGIFVITPQFTGASTFSEGLATVRINNKLGYINTAGKIVINPQFDQTTMFSGGLAVVSVSGHQGIIDKQGKYVVNPGQFNIQLAEGDLQTVTGDDGVGLITRDGKWVVKPTKAISGIQWTVGKVFYGNIHGSLIPIATSGKILTSAYKGAMLDTLAQDLDNEDKAEMSVRGLITAETSYSGSYAAKGFTASLNNLGPATGVPDENHAGLIDATLATGAKDGYQFTVTIPSGTSTGGTNFNYFLLAKPVAGHSFCADSSGDIHNAGQGDECTLTSPTL